MSRMQRIDSCEQPSAGVLTRAGCSRTLLDQTGTAPHLLYSGGSDSEWCVLTRPGSADVSRLHPRILECWSVDDARGVIIVTESAPDAVIADQFRPFGSSNPGTVLSVRLVAENIASARFDCIDASGGAGSTPDPGSARSQLVDVTRERVRLIASSGGLRRHCRNRDCAAHGLRRWRRRPVLPGTDGEVRGCSRLTSVAWPCTGALAGSST